jgi:hypothetical protein
MKKNEPTTAEGWVELSYKKDKTMLRLKEKAKKADLEQQAAIKSLCDSPLGQAAKIAEHNADKAYKKFKQAEADASYALRMWRLLREKENTNED